MHKPPEYVELMDEFMRLSIKGTKLENANREDVAALRMLAYLKDLPVDIRIVKGTVYIVRSV